MYIVGVLCLCLCCFFFSSRRRHTRCALVTGVQTCALPIFAAGIVIRRRAAGGFEIHVIGNFDFPPGHAGSLLIEAIHPPIRSEERRVGKECVSTCRSRWSTYH